MLAKLRSLSINNVEDQCRLVDRAWSTACALPPPSDSNFTGKCNPCGKAVALLKRCQPSMLERWTPGYTEGDGNCMFRALSQAVFGTQSLHVHLRVLACLEVGNHRSAYDKDSPLCHELLLRTTLLPPTFCDLWNELCSLGTSCCYVALLALSAVLQLRVYSFFPPLQSTFVSPLTVEIVGRGVPEDARSVAVMWSTMSDVPASGPVSINHIVPLLRRDNTAVENSERSADVSGVAVSSGTSSGMYPEACCTRAKQHNIIRM